MVGPTSTVVNIPYLAPQGLKIPLFLLDSELRLFGFGNLSTIAFMLAIIFLIILDTPLKLGTFEWAEAFWPGGEKIALPEPGTGRRIMPPFGQIGNSLKVSGFIIVVVVFIAGFASLIPQVESPAPEVLEISGDLSGPELATLGEEVFRSAEAGCLACHGLGQEGLRAPDLAGIGGRETEAYLRESLVDPCATVVEGYDCIMPQTLVQSLGAAKIIAVIAFLQSQGGEVTVTLSADEAESSAAESSAGGPAVAGTTAAEIFANALPTCATCHQLDALGAAGAVGPDLSQVGGRLTPDEIRESILMPEAAIAEDCPGVPCAAGIMPKTYGEQLNAMQLETLVIFLSEQK
jgi:cytochrome c2